MGRCAFFSTEVEYKFWFDNNIKLSFSVEVLNAMVKKYNFTLPKFEDYTKDMEGSIQLYEDLRTNIWQDTPENAKFCLGCLIYHQLTYTPKLTCQYEE